MTTTGPDLETTAPRWASSLLQRAVLAPSSHNTQPWLFRLGDDTVDLHADRTRALPVNDPDDRELTISCGCALLNLRLGAAALGRSTELELLPQPGDPDWLARVTLGSWAVAADDAELAEQIERRGTWRKRFESKPVPAETVRALVTTAESENCWLRPVEGEEERHALAELVAEGDAAQWADPRWRRELAAWMHPRRKGDGLTLPGLAIPIARVVVRTFDMGGGVGARDRELADESPLLAVLGTERDDERAWLEAGQGLERVLLEACRHGLQASYLNQPVQVASLRPKLQHRVGGGFPQIVLRLGVVDGEVSPAPRRPVEEVIEESPRP